MLVPGASVHVSFYLILTNSTQLEAKPKKCATTSLNLSNSKQEQLKRAATYK